MSFGDSNNPYGQPQQPPQGGGYGAPQQPPQGTPGYGYPQQAPQGVPPQGYNYPQQPGQPYGTYPQQQPAYGSGGMPELAHWGLRFVASLLDSLTIYLIPLIIYYIGIGKGNGALIAVGGLAYLGTWIWNVVRQGRTGQTVGKKIMKISVLREADGQPLGAGMAFARTLAHFLDGLACYLGWLWPLWDSKKQTFADKIVSSVVVRVN